MTPLESLQITNNSTSDLITDFSDNLATHTPNLALSTGNVQRTSVHSNDFINWMLQIDCDVTNIITKFYADPNPVDWDSAWSTKNYYDLLHWDRSACELTCRRLTNPILMEHALTSNKRSRVLLGPIREEPDEEDILDLPRYYERRDYSTQPPTITEHALYPPPDDYYSWMQGCDCTKRVCTHTDFSLIRLKHIWNNYMRGALVEDLLHMSFTEVWDKYVEFTQCTLQSHHVITTSLPTAVWQDEEFVESLDYRVNQFAKNVKSNHYYKFFRHFTVKDFQMLHDLSTIHSGGSALPELHSVLSDVYRVKNIMRFADKTAYCEKFCQDFHIAYPQPLAQGFFDNFSIRIRDDVVRASLITIKSTVLDVYSSMRTKFFEYWETIKSYVGMLSQELSSGVKKLYDYFANWFSKVIENIITSIALKISAPAMEFIRKKLLQSLFLVGVYVLLRQLNIFSRPILSGIWSMISVKACTGDEAVGQSEPDFATLLATLCIGMIGIKAIEFDHLKKFVGKMQSIMSGGTILSNSLKLFLVLLPPVLKTALVYKFGTRESVFQQKAELWRLKAEGLAAVSKVQTVAVSQDYSTHVKSTVRDGNLLFRQMTSEGLDQANKNVFLAAYARLIKIHANIVFRETDSGGRQVPFTFHIAGESGLGKTSSVYDIAAALGYSRQDCANKNCSETFWTGCQGKKVIIMDEFLLGSQEDNHLFAQAYLVGSSCAEWRPEFASIDDPTVGIKGTPLRPDMLISMNNTIHDRVDHKIDDALQRRRQFVVEFRPSTKYIEHPTQPGNVDISAYTQAEITDRVWMYCNIWPGKHTPGKTPTPIHKGFTYQQMKNFVVDQGRLHLEMNERLTTMNPDMTETRDPKEILDTVMHEVYDLPCRPMSISAAFSALMQPLAVGQGPQKTNITPEYFAQAEAEVRDEELNTVILEEEPEGQGPSQFSAVTVGCSIAAMITVIAGTISLFTGKNEEVTYGQSTRTNKTTKRPRGRGKFVKAKIAKGQAPAIQVLDMHHNGLVQKVIPIGKRFFLTYAHGIHDAPYGQWGIEVNGLIHMTEVCEDNVWLYEEGDLAVIDFSANRQLPEYKDITKHFLSEDEIDQLSNCTVQLDIGTGKLHSRLIKRLQAPYICGGDHRVQLEVAGKYDGVTELGDCGTPVMIRSGDSINRIAGIHVAGTGSTSSSPHGLCAFVPREILIDLMEEATVCAQGPSCEGPNLIKTGIVPPNQRVKVPTSTKLEPSEISEYLPWPVEKQPSIMSEKDPRAKGVDPAQVFFNTLCNKPQVHADQKIIDEIEEEIYDKFSQELKWPVGKRMLTFEEGCAGVPKYLNSITTKTSPGYPLVLFAQKKGKTDYVWFDEDGELRFTEYFKGLVLERVEVIQGYKGEELEHRFLMYFKDELVKESKIEDVRTRATFANDLISLVAFRMIFGAVSVALSHSFDCTGFATGFNQYSEDMEIFYQHLTKAGPDRMVAGDYKSFDINYAEQFSKMAYSIFGRLAVDSIPGVTQKAVNFLYEHEARAPIQYKDLMAYVVTANKSGCWLTTPSNNIVDLGYIMYCFKRKYPTKPFWEIVAAIFLGDDHIYNVAKGYDMTPLEISVYMKEIGQEYTSAFKNEELKDEYSSFAETTFLGAIPRQNYRNVWTGALRKSTLESTPMWTRDSNLTLDQKIQQMIECASQWDREYFNKYTAQLKAAYLAAGREWNLETNYSVLHHTVTKRTAESGEDFVLRGQGPIKVNAKSQFNTGLTQVLTAEEATPSAESGNLVSHIAGKSCSAENATFNYGTESYVRRTALTWSTSGTAGTILASYNVPFDLITLGNTEMVQNLGFMNFLFCQPEVEVMIRVTGTPVMQGALVAWFQPLVTVAQLTATGAPSINHWTTMDHIFLVPNNNTTRSLRIPFRFWRTYINNMKGFTNSEFASMGTLQIGIFSPLTVLSAPTSATVTIYTRFKTDFKIPRPRTANGQGATYSSINSNYTVGNVAGNMPNQTSMSTTQTLDQNLALPMDNPPLSGGSIPTYRQYSAMSKAVGVEPTTSLQMCQEELSREGDSLRFSDETSLAMLLNKRGYLGFTTISTSTAVNTEILQLNLNSLIFEPSVDSANNMPMNIAILNQFMRWRGDIVLEFFCSKTVFHAIRLQLVIAYGYHGALGALDYNGFPQEIIEFTQDTQWASVRIPYNCATEYLKTYDGLTTTFGDDYRMGAFSIFTSTPLLVSSSVVASSVDFHTFVRFDNVEVYEPRSDVFISLKNSDQLTQLVGQGPMESENSGSISNGSASVVPETTVINVERKAGDDDNPDDVAITQPGSDRKMTPCRLKLGSKYEYLVGDITELGRRHYYVPIQSLPGWTTNQFQATPSLGQDYHNSGHDYPYFQASSFFVTPVHPICNVFAGWSGHVKYRIIVSPNYGNDTSYIVDVPNPIQVGYVPSVSSNITQTVPPFTGTIPPAAGVANSSNYDFMALAPAQSTVGKSGTSQTPSWASNTYLYKPDTVINSSAVEVIYQQAKGQIVADISVPFATNYNVLPTIQSVSSGSFPTNTPQHNGRLVIITPSNALGIFYDIRVYQAFGDDMRLHGYSPIWPSYADGITKASFGTGTVTLPTGSVGVGQAIYQ